MSIKSEKLTYVYNVKTPFEFKALDEINFELESGKITAIVGHTGSGKSTLMQHFNALLTPTEGKITINNRVIEAGIKNKGLKSLRKEVGLVFQFPEYQLFEQTITKDVMFGPLNFNVSEDEALEKSNIALEKVGLKEIDKERSPLELSGGQKRRVAIAGILAMEPTILCLDEPTSGLDPQGSIYMKNLFKSININENKTIIMITHDMQHVLDICDNVLVLAEGKVIKHCSVVEFFKDIDMLESLHIELPNVIKTRIMLNEKGFNIPDDVILFDDLTNCIQKELNYE